MNNNMSVNDNNQKIVIKREEKVGYEYIESNIPKPNDGEILIKVEYVSICGSDINLYNWNNVAKQIAALPFTPGHECVGIVHEIGNNCDNYDENYNEILKVGDRVCVENHFFCDECYQCKHNQKHICQNMSQFGHGKGTKYGGFSQYTIVDHRYLYKLKTNLDAKFACLLEPFGVAHHACEEVGVNKDDSVFITGCGPVGLMAIAISKAMGAKKVIASDILPERLNIAKELGCDIIINAMNENVDDIIRRETNNNGVGCLIEASGAQINVNNCFTFVRKGGRVLMLGLPKASIQIDNPLSTFIFRSLTVKTIHGRKIFHTWNESEKLLASNQVDISPVISAIYPLEEYDKAHQFLLSGKGCKILVKCI